jgi:hypothetical protein
MAFNIDFQINGHSSMSGASVSVTGKASTGAFDLPASGPPRQFTVQPSESAAFGVPAGRYERVGTAASGNPIYADCRRGH